MIHEIIPLHEAGSLPGACFETYFIEESEEYKIKKRPAVIICPGGGYCYLSTREGEIMAMQYFAMGYQTVVLKYSIAPAVPGSPDRSSKNRAYPAGKCRKMAY